MISPVVVEVLARYWQWACRWQLEYDPNGQDSIYYHKWMYPIKCPHGVDCVCQKPKTEKKR
jgi:hypothetical protein